MYKNNCLKYNIKYSNLKNQSGGTQQLLLMSCNQCIEPNDVTCKKDNGEMSTCKKESSTLLSENDINIKGPSNIIYLKRESDSKKIYVIYDIHNVPENCDGESLTITDFIDMLKKNKEIDLFVEHSRFLLVENPDTDSLYLLRNYINNCSSSINCHSIDIREDLMINTLLLKQIQNLYTDHWNYLTHTHKDGHAANHYIIKLIKNQIMFIDSRLSELINRSDYKIRTFPDKLIMNEIFIKEYDKIENDPEKESFLELNSEFKKLWKDFCIKSIDFLKKLDKNSKYEEQFFETYIFDSNKINDQWIKDKKLPDEFKNILEVIEYMINILSLLVDIYTIGRLLKPYINNLVIYVGAQHGTNIVKELIKKFNFKIEYSDSDYSDIGWQDSDIKTCINIKNLPIWT